MPCAETKLNVSEKFTGRYTPARRWEIIGLMALIVTLLLPFLRRAFAIDDPLFIWMGRHILEFPLNPYGFSVNWSVIHEPMSVVMQNPPLNSYFIAAIIFFAGLSETVLHAAFLLPAIAAVSGVYLIARRFCTRPFEATLVAILTPAFLVCGSTVMCDMMLLAFWVWAIYFWVSGLDKNCLWKILLASVLITLGALTKYYGVVLLPLLLLYSLLIRRKVEWWMFLGLIPVVSLIAYNYWTESLYGQGLLLDAFKLSGQYRDARGISVISKSLVTLAFAGGCLSSVIFFAPLLWNRKTLAALVGIGAALFLFFGFRGNIGNYSFKPANNDQWLLAAHIGLFVTGGISILILAIRNLVANKNADSALLFCWLLGTLLFAGYFNWTVNGRSLLIAAPALGIIIMRQIEEKEHSTKTLAAFSFILPLILSSLVALAVAQADYRFANSQRDAAYSVHQRFSSTGKMLFQGHWGFQYYMELLGAKPVEYLETKFDKGDVVVVPENNTFVDNLPDDLKINRINVPSGRWLSTMNKFKGTAFHSDAWGPIPYGFGLTVPETYYVIKAYDVKSSSLSLLGSDTVRRNALIVRQP
ncbi:MAG: glycosyltransferase family 39 protein [Deltaproteobacteria bacterium]|nr:glycosyltransferase family 39 protein [Deltaproteobacteria bacterium]